MPEAFDPDPSTAASSALDGVARARGLLTENRPREALEAIEAAYRSHPDDVTVLRLLARLRQASGKPSLAVAAYRRLYARGDEAGALDGLFSLLMGARRYRVAARLAPRVAARTPLASLRAKELAELGIATHDVDGALAMLDLAGRPPAAGGLDRLRFIAGRLGDELAAGDVMQGRRHLAIAGSAFCGSTILGLILGSTPGFAFAGETHWLTNARIADGSLESIVGTELPVVKWPVACRVCKRDCQCFDVAFRVQLAGDNTGWYAKIADRMQVRNLVTADKNLQLFEEHDPLSRFDYILSYKEPVSYLRSLLKQFLRQPGPPKPVTTAWAIAHLDRWADNYWRHLKAVRPTGRRVVLDWEGFMQEPRFHIERLAHLLALPLRGDVVDHIRLDHFIGGNMGVDVEALRADPALRLRKTNAPPLPADLQEVAMAHEGARRVTRVLNNEYRRDFRTMAASA